MKPEKGDGNPHRSDTFREMIRSQRKNSQKEDGLRKESNLRKNGGSDGTRTRNLCRDRAAL